MNCSKWEERVLNGNIMKKIIYVELLNEGTVSYRPVYSDYICDNIYILGEKDDDFEEWAFNSGEYVITEPHVFSDGTICPLVKDYYTPTH